MSSREVLVEELRRQPDAVARKLLDYLHALVPESAQNGAATLPQGNFATYWNRYYGAFDGEVWEEPPELPAEKREEW